MAGRPEAVFDPALIATVRERLRFPPPVDDGWQRTCWSLQRIQSTFPALPPRTLSGLWRLLRRSGIRLRHGRPQLYSPDPAYLEKEAALLAVLKQVAAAEGRQVVVFLDEFTLTHWPLVGRDWSSLPGPPPCARRAAPGERRSRIVGTLDGRSGRVLVHRDTAIGKTVLATFLGEVAAAYPAAERIVVVLDNWPVHHAPEVQDAVAASGRLELLFLPTYAPWLNPIEKLWALLKQAVLRLHQHAGAWPVLKQQVMAFFAAFAAGSPELLHLVGLSGTGTLATALTTDLQNQK